MKEEKTALSAINGLRQKFARERDKAITYTAEELHLMLSACMGKIKREEEVVFETSESWDEVNEQVEKSGIKRYPWKEVFGTSLTQMILTFKKHGFNQEETRVEIEKDPAFVTFLESHNSEKDKILENVKISIHARFGENETAKKVMEE